MSTTVPDGTSAPGAVTRPTEDTGFTHRQILVILSGLCGLGSMVLLLRSHHSVARLLAMGAVATVVLGWGVAQYPYILPTSMTLSAAAAPDATLWSVVVVFLVAAVVILPSLGLLYYLDQRDLLAAPAVEPGLAEEG